MTKVIVLFLLGAIVSLAPQCSDQSSVNEQIKNRGEGKDNWWDSLPREAWSKFEPIVQSQGWFEVYRILPDVYAIYEPGQFEEVISYLIEGSERALLFDTGLGIGNIKSVVEELTDGEVTVLNSHTHYDHIGGNHQFDRIYSMDTEFTRRSSHGAAHGDVKEFVGEGWIWKATPDGFDPDGYHIKPFTSSQFVSDGEKLDLGDRVLEIIHTPGHTPDSICLLDRENRILFMGDTFYPGPLYAHLEGADPELYAESAKRLASIQSQVDRILPAHNEPLIESGYLIKMADAFSMILEGNGEFVISDGNREYKFDGFSIITK